MDVDVNTDYFDGYGAFDVHEMMLKDKIRTNSYRSAIAGNPSIFSGAVVLDVGCGTGILSLFAASSGAKKVYGVDNSGMSEYARKVVEKNNLADVIQVIHGIMEETEIPEQVDVIISEWMGFCLLYESMLPSVIDARDRFLKPGGTMFPNYATLFIAGLCDRKSAKRAFGLWDDICGFNLSAMKQLAMSEPRTAAARSDHIVTDNAELIAFDLNTTTADQLSLDVPFKLTPKSDQLNAFVIWFDVRFDGPDSRVVLSTSPFQPETHWAQAIFYLPEPIGLEPDVPIAGRFVMHPNATNYRSQDLRIVVSHQGEVKTYDYKMK